MGRIGALRVRWSTLSQPRRAGVVAAVVLAAGLVGVGISAASGQGTRAPVVWRDHVADATTTTAAPLSMDSTAGRGRP